LNALCIIIHGHDKPNQPIQPLAEEVVMKLQRQLNIYLIFLSLKRLPKAVQWTPISTLKNTSWFHWISISCMVFWDSFQFLWQEVIHVFVI